MPADLDQSTLIDALVRYATDNGKPALQKIFNDALANSLRGVQLTSVSWEGGSGTGTPSELSTAKLLVLAEQALQLVDGNGVTSPRGIAINYGARILET